MGSYFTWIRECLIAKDCVGRWLVLIGIGVVGKLAASFEWLITGFLASALLWLIVDKRKEGELQKAKLASLLDNLPHMVWFKDTDGRFLTVNQPFLDRLCLTRDRVIGKTDFDLLPEDIAQRYDKDDRLVVMSGQRLRTETKTFINTQEYWEETYKSPVFGMDGQLLGTTGISLNITQRKLHEAEISRMAYIDGLTGLPNRTHLQLNLAEEMEKIQHGEAVGGAVLLIDIDNLKLVNDALGHSYGDDLIRIAGMYISAKTGERSIVTRVGGDEFVVILYGETDRSKVAAIATGIVNVLNRDFYILDSNICISVSIGATLYPDDGKTSEEILQNADMALYVAKGNGKNTWRFYEPSIKKRTNEKMSLKRSLRKAIERRELVLHYQPLVAASGRKIVSFEALLRWNSAEHGAVPPSQFIPLAEEDDNIKKIGKWVLFEACQFARRMADAGHSDVGVIVNVSPRQVGSLEFLEQVFGAIRAAGIHPRQLEIEITENILLGLAEDTTEKLNVLRQSGIRLSLDDFGTGYSSLTCLRNFPFQTLKIDKSFIDSIVIDKRQSQFIASIIDMAHILGLTVVAEGVETEEQFERLFEYDCDLVQGFVFSKPVPIDDAIRLLSRDAEKLSGYRLRAT